MEYRSEEEFLKHYDSSQFEKLSMTADILIFSVSDGLQENYRKLNEKLFSVLLVRGMTIHLKISGVYLVDLLRSMKVSMMLPREF